MTTKVAPETTEIIEIIDDDTEAFAASHVAGSPAIQGKGSHRSGPIAAVALVAAVGYGVITSTISPDTKPAQRTTTSVPTPRTSATLTPVSPRAAIISPAYYVADPPPGFTMHFAETLGMGGNTADFTNSASADLWATDGATATTGSWFVVSRGTHHSTGRNAFRTIVGDVEVVEERDTASGQKHLSFTKDGNELEITAFHWSDGQLLQLVASVHVSSSAIRYDDTFFTSDHKLLLAADPTVELYGLPVAWVGYTTEVPAEWAKSFTITVAGNSPDRTLASRFALTDTTSFTVGDRPATIGRSAADRRLSIVQWRDGERLITMRGNLAADQMMAIAQTVHPAPFEAVQALVGHPLHSTALDPAGRATVAAGTLADGSGWDVQVSTWTHQGAAEYLWWIGQSDGGAAPRLSLADAGPSIEPFVEHGRTYVLARVPRSMVGAQLHTSPNGVPSTITPLLDVDPVMNDLFAAYVFVEPVPFSAWIVDSSGATIATWPSP